MIDGLLGQKLGMSQLIQEDGLVIPVTVVAAGPCVVTQIKRTASDGYNAIQLGFQPTKNTNRPKQGHIKANNSFRFLRELAVDNPDELEIGQQIKADIFTIGDLVTVAGRSKGKGFQGTVKRHGFGGGQRTHGQSDRLRAPGSIGMGTTPGRVFKGKKMSGHMGDEQVTIKNLKIVSVDADRHLLFLKGGVPGSPKGLLTIKSMPANEKN